VIRRMGFREGVLMGEERGFRARTPGGVLLHCRSICPGPVLAHLSHFPPNLAEHSRRGRLIRPWHTLSGGLGAFTVP
jgi:hypothetical protein